MRRALTPVIVCCALLAGFAPAAHAGSSIKQLGSCDGAYTNYDAQSRAEFRSAIVCLVTQVRAAEKLPALTRSSKLESAGQSHAKDEAKHRYAAHERGSSTIASRIRHSGYRAAAYNEGLELGDENATPYDLVRDMMAQRSVPCTEILDPRFRDAGVGVQRGRAPGGFPGNALYLVVEFGLRAGSKPASGNGAPARSCPHRLPAPPFTGDPVVPQGGGAVAHADTITVTVLCDSRVACAFRATMKLPDAANATSAPIDARLGPHDTQALTFAFDSAAISSELSSSQPKVMLTIAGTEPAKRTDEFTGPLQRGG